MACIFVCTDGSYDSSPVMGINVIPQGNEDVAFTCCHGAGMRPVMFSQTGATRGRGWRRCGEGIKYYPTHAPFYACLAGRPPRKDQVRD
jgi:hypothetical protein